jgi:hypothetical protein
MQWSATVTPGAVLLAFTFAVTSGCSLACIRHARRPTSIRSMPFDMSEHRTSTGSVLALVSTRSPQT